MVSIVAFQAIDPGSIPGQRIFLFYFILLFWYARFLLFWMRAWLQATLQRFVRLENMPRMIICVQDWAGHAFH